MRSFAGRCLRAVLMLGALASPAAGQDFRGAISGAVVGQSGGVLPGVTVVVTNTATGVAVPVVTDGSGLYQVSYLNPGEYSVSAELQGFTKVVRTGNEVRVADKLRVDIIMTAGTVSETITVAGE